MRPLLQDLRFAHSLRTVMRNCMPDFMAEHGRQPSIVECDRQNSGINTHFSARQAEGVGFRAVEHDKLPLRIGQVLARYRRDAFANPLDGGVGGGIAADGRIGLELVETGKADFHFVPGRNQIQFPPASNRDCRAPRDK